MACSQCQQVRINGLVCHETGCPLSHVGTHCECKWCGDPFTPDYPRQTFCDEDCAASYFGMDDLPGECHYDQYNEPCEWDVVGGL